MADILKAGESGFGILIENDAGYIGKDLNKNLIKENQEFIVEPNKPLYINCILQKWGVKNRNGRIYPKEVLIPQVEEYRKLVEGNSAVSEADHPDCVCASESDICTKDGWKNIGEISEDEEILTLNTETNKIEIQKIDKKIFTDYKGKMYKFSNVNIDLTVTGNHRFLLENGKGERKYYYAKDIYEDLNGIYSSGKYKILKPDNLDEETLTHFTLDKTIKIEEIDFDGDIACVRVKNSNFLVRVNGKSHWTGNSSIISLSNISHMITKMWWGTGDQSHILFGQLKLIITRGFVEMGIVSVIGDKILLYLQNGVKLGISSRGVGSLEEINGENIVQDDFELIGFDLVATPSTPGAYLYPATDNMEQSIKETYIKKNGVYLKEESEKIINGINKFLI